MSAASSRLIACMAKVAITWTPRAISCSASIPANGRPRLPISKSRKLPLANGCRSASAIARKYDLPTVFSILIYTPETSLPLAICDGSYRTVMCTGGAAVSVKWMARKNSKRPPIAGPAIWPRHTRQLQGDFPVGGGAGVEPVSNRRINQRAVAPGADKRERYSRRDRRGHYRSQAGTAFGGRDHSLRLYRNCASGLGDGAARV